jgi:hypothetical protein
VPTGFWWGNLRKRDHLKDLGIVGRTIEIDLQEVGRGSMHWIHLARDTDRWRVLVNAAINLRRPYNSGNFLSR